MLTPVFEIQIGGIRFRGCHEFKITKSVDEASVTGKITLPRMVLFDSKQRSFLSVAKEVKMKDPVTIKAGYKEDEIHQLFTGYVKAVNTGDRVVIDIEDPMFLLRLKPIVITKKDVTLKALLGELVSGTGLSVSGKSADMKIDEFQYNGNVAGAISKLKESLKLTVYINGSNQVYAGGESMELLSPEDSPYKLAKLTYGRNIISNNVEYQTAESKPILIVVKGKKKKGEEVVATAGMDGGDKQTYMRYNVTDKDTLQQIADELYAKQSYTGFRGTLTIFGIPRVVMGGTIQYRNENYQDVEGRYFVKGVEITGGPGGLRQIATLGYKL